MATLQSIHNKYLYDGYGHSTFTGIADNHNNVMLLAFKLATQDALVAFNFTDGFLDEFEDANSVDATASLYETYDATNDLYSRDAGASSGQNFILVSTGQTASKGAPQSAAITIFEEDVDAITINTDLKAFVSRDDGTTYTEITLADKGDYASSKQIWSGNISTVGDQPTGTTMRYKIRLYNNKNAKIHGVALTWG
jgi:hypothetical protein|tara:strand:- start:303 stop:890 length:588 start_codon:yes stop_codon:yes gene_type:complete